MVSQRLDFLPIKKSYLKSEKSIKILIKNLLIWHIVGLCRFNNSLISPVVKIAKTSVYGPVYGRTWLIRLEVWFRMSHFRRFQNVNLKILIFGSDKDWSSSVGSTTMLQKYFNPRRLTNQFFWRWTNISTRFLLVSYQATLN